MVTAITAMILTAVARWYVRYRRREMNSPYLIIDRSGNAVDINLASCHDKRKSCHGCPDRVADPNCHGTCKGYIDRAAESKQKSALIRAEKARNAITYLPEGELHKRQKAISAARSWKKNKEGI